MPNSIVSFNALTAWLRKVNNDLKTEHIHIEIRANYSLDDINWLCSCHGLVQPLNNIEQPSPTFSDLMLSDNNFPPVQETTDTSSLTHERIVTEGISLIDDIQGDPRRERMKNIRSEITMATALERIDTVDYPEEELGKFFTELQCTKPKAIFLDLEGSRGSAIGISFIRSVADTTKSG